MRYFSNNEKIINLKTPLKNEEELKAIKFAFAFLSEQTQKNCGGLKDPYPKKLLPSQMTQLTAGNLGRPCKPPYEVKVYFQQNLETNVS